MLREMYDGKIIPWERHNRCSAEQLEIVKKSPQEKNTLLKRWRRRIINSLKNCLTYTLSFPYQMKSMFFPMDSQLVYF